MPGGAGSAARKESPEAEAETQVAVPAPPVALDQVRTSLEELGLNGYQSRVLLSLLRLGSAGPAQLARLAGVHRTSVYPVLHELRALGLAQQAAGQSATWTSPGHEEVLDRLRVAQEDRLVYLKAKAESARRLLADLVPSDPAGSTPYVHLISSASQARATFDRLLDEAVEEFIVLNRPPYSAAVEGGRSYRAALEAEGREEINPAVLRALGRGVSIRVLYEKAAWAGNDASGFRAAMVRYHDAGVEGRLVESLPMKLGMADRSSAMFGLADPVLREVGFPMTVLIEHEGYCQFQAEAFESHWRAATKV